MPRLVRSRLWAGLAAGVLAVAAPVAATAGVAQAASTPGPNTPEKVPTGPLAAALPGAAAFGTTPASTPEKVSFILRERDKKQLESAVTGGLTSFDSVDGFAARYGQGDGVVSALTGYLAGFGITTTVYPGNVDVSASGTAGEFDQALDCLQKQYHVPAQGGADGQSVPAQTVYSATSEPKLPYRLSKAVLAIFGLTDYSPFVSTAVHAGPRSKPADVSGGTVNFSHLPSTFAKRYGLTPLYKKADGAGETVGIVTLAALDPGAPQHFWSKVAKVPSTGRTLTTLNVDGGPGKPSDASGTLETDLDVEQSGALAYGANVVVYQAPNTDAGFIDAYFAAAGANLADSVSASWGESEDLVRASVAAGEETAAYESAFDEVFLELADQGQSAFVAAGDDGAYDPFDDLGTTELGVDTSADSPYVTAAGGTTLPYTGTYAGPKGKAKVTVAKERAWGWDYLWKPYAVTNGISYAASAQANIGGSGGGFSALEPEPSYQALVSGTSRYTGVKYLTPEVFKPVTGTDILEPTAWKVTAKAPLGHGTATGRAVPDVSANADPYTGYLVYEPSGLAIGQPALQNHWGGTSFVAPQFNGSAAVIDSFTGHRTGLWNPSLYALAAGPHSPVTPLDTAGGSNDNLFYTGTAGTRYNPATGLGVPNLARYAQELAG